MQEIQKFPTVTSLQIQQTDPCSEKEKKSIYCHPLFPILALLLDKCEQATSSPDSQIPDTFESDLQSYIQRHEANDNRIFLADNVELDSLFVKAIQVLRIHINELRKVNELCKDFCTRYINCLKEKIHQDSMFDDSDDSSTAGSERLSPNLLPRMDSVFNNPYNSIGRNYLEMGPNHGHEHVMRHPMNGRSIDCGSSPTLSAISVQDDNANRNNCLSSSTNSVAYNNLLDASKQKRGVLPKKATQVMKQWLFQHLVHPYPTEDEKRQLANQTNLTLLQVNNWFINARRRILQPMLDNGGSLSKEKSTINDSKLEKIDSVSECDDAGSGLMYSSSCGNRKKKAATNRPSNNRFWPASLAAAVNILSVHHPNSNCTVTSPIITVTSERNQTKWNSQHDSVDKSRSQKRTKSFSTEPDSYRPRKVFASSKDSYESYRTELDYKSHHKDTNSQSETSTPHFCEHSSPNNSKLSSPMDIVRSETYCPPDITRNSSTRFAQECKESIASNLCTREPNRYVSPNSYANIMPQTDTYITHPAMIYNANLQQSDQNSMSSALFGMRHPPNHTFPIYMDSIYPSYEQTLDQRTIMAELFSGPSRLPRVWDDPISVKNLPLYAHTNSITESGSLTNQNHSYSYLERFTNFNAFQSKTN